MLHVSFQWNLASRFFCPCIDTSCAGDSFLLFHRQALRRWQRSRQFVCLVASDKQSSDQLTGCAVLSMAAPEAYLPPPFPSGAPLRCCVSNVAVDGGFRRKGVARRLLKRCETIGEARIEAPVPLLRLSICNMPVSQAVGKSNHDLDHIPVIQKTV